MEPFYIKLKQLRESQDIALEDVQKRTKINLEYLSAFEEGDFQVLPMTYIRLFVKAYVKEIGGDPDDALTQLEHYLSSEGIETDPIPGSYSNDKLDESQEFTTPPVNGQSNRKMRSNLIKGGALIIVWIFALFIVKQITLDGDAAQKNDQSIPNIRENLVTEQDLLTDYIIFSTNNFILEAQPPFVFKIIAIKPVSYRITSDTTALQTFTCLAGEQRTFEYQSALSVLFTHTDGVTAYLNGEEINGVRAHQDPVQLKFKSDPTTASVNLYSRIN